MRSRGGSVTQQSTICDLSDPLQGLSFSVGSEFDEGIGFLTGDSSSFELTSCGVSESFVRGRSGDGLGEDGGDDLGEGGRGDEVGGRVV
jgi:hypothetical protein